MKFTKMLKNKIEKKTKIKQNPFLPYCVKKSKQQKMHLIDIAMSLTTQIVK